MSDYVNQIEAETAMDTLYCIGDSHVCFFTGKDEIVVSLDENSSTLPYFRAFHIGPVLAYNLCENNTKTKGREIILHLLQNRIPAGSRLLFCFGEIDCRYHILKQADIQKKSFKSVVHQCVNQYYSFIREVREKGFDVVVWNATPSAPDRLPMDSGYPRYGTCVQRNKVTGYFNQQMRKILSNEGIKFISIFDKLVDKKNHTKEKYLTDGIHLSQRAMPLALKEFKKHFKDFFEQKIEDPLRLCIGGTNHAEGWKILNNRPGPHVDYEGGCFDLSRFGDNSVDEIYISRVLAQLEYAGELVPALKEIYRVLKPAGLLRVSVPDLETLCSLFLNSRLNERQRFYIMRIMFGVRADENEFNNSGLTREFLAGYLKSAGFSRLKESDGFNTFNDYSSKHFFGRPVFLNIEAAK